MKIFAKYFLLVRANASGLFVFFNTVLLFLIKGSFLNLAAFSKAQNTVFVSLANDF